MIINIASIIGQVSTLAGTTVCISGTIAAGTCVGGSADGVGTNAMFCYPWGVAVNPVGTLLYVTDFNNNNIRTIALPSGNEHIHMLMHVYLFVFM
jgi:DNA-binding beta-propeller fold protein YncE